VRERVKRKRPGRVASTQEDSLDGAGKFTGVAVAFNGAKEPSEGTTDSDVTWSGGRKGCAKGESPKEAQYGVCGP